MPVDSGRLLEVVDETHRERVADVELERRSGDEPGSGAGRERRTGLVRLAFTIVPLPMSTTVRGGLLPRRERYGVVLGCVSARR
jgi:hypothetical protein